MHSSIGLLFIIEILYFLQYQKKKQFQHQQN